MFSNNGWAQHQLRHRTVPIARAAAWPLQGALGDRETGKGWICTPNGISVVWSRRPQALRIFRDSVLCAGPPFPSALRRRDGEGRTHQTVRATPRFLSLFPISIFPPSPPFSARFRREFQPLAAVITTPPDSLPSLAVAGSLGASLPPAAPEPQSRGTTGTAATTVVPADRQTGINTHTYLRTVPGSCGRGSVWPGAGLRHDAGLCG